MSGTESSFYHSLRKFSEGSIQAVPFEYSRVPVVLELQNKVLTSYVETLYQELESATSIMGGSVPFSLGELVNYCQQLVKIRVDYVNRTHAMFGPTEKLAVPAFLSVVLENIGLAEDVDRGIELYPTLSGFESLMSAQEMSMMTTKLKTLSRYGFEYAEGYSRDRKGSWDFMTMTLIDGYVRSISKEAHPVYALMASVLATHGVEAAMSPRITYGSEANFIRLVRQLATVKQ
jgi:hypothetical protein